MSSAPEFPDVRELVPHRGPILLLDRIVAHDRERTQALVRIEKQHWLEREDGSVASWLALEYMAQCTAAHEGLRARAENRPPPHGFLMSATELRLEASSYPASARLLVSAVRARGRPGLGVMSHRCELVAAEGGQVLARGRLSISVTREEP